MFRFVHTPGKERGGSINVSFRYIIGLSVIFIFYFEVCPNTFIIWKNITCKCTSIFKVKSFSSEYKNALAYSPHLTHTKAEKIHFYKISNTICTYVLVCTFVCDLVLYSRLHSGVSARPLASVLPTW